MSVQRRRTARAAEVKAKCASVSASASILGAWITYLKPSNPRDIHNTPSPRLAAQQTLTLLCMCMLVCFTHLTMPDTQLVYVYVFLHLQ